MAKSIYTIILCTLTAYMVSSCDMYDFLWFYNDSSETVYLFFQHQYDYRDPKFIPTVHPDTLMPQSVTDIGRTMSRLEPNTHAAYYQACVGFFTEKEDIIEYDFETDTFTFFIISADTLDRYGYQRVAEDYNILARYNPSKKDLKKIKGDIHYPPTPAMMNMRMYPPYKEILNRNNTYK